MSITLQIARLGLRHTNFHSISKRNNFAVFFNVPAFIFIFIFVTHFHAIIQDLNFSRFYF